MFSLRRYLVGLLLITPVFSMEEKTSDNHDVSIPTLGIEGKSGINNEKAYTDLFKLFTINGVKNSFLKDVESELFRAVLFRCDDKDLAVEQDFLDLFGCIFADYEAKDHALTNEEDFDYVVRYSMYRDNLQKLFLIQKIMEESPMFFDKAKIAIVNSLKGGNKVGPSKEIIYNLAKDSIRDIKRTILFLNKWGEYIVMMIEEQRKSLIIANQKCGLDSERKVKVLSLRSSDLSMTNKALLQPKLNLQALQEKFEAQFSDVLDLLQGTVLKSTKSGV